MGQKDISEKLLEDYNDVFADIVNVLQFNGERRVKPESLEDSNLKSQYKADDGKLHEQERDVMKHWKEGRIRLAVYGLENQTDIDEQMPVRIFGYEGANYRSQYGSEQFESDFGIIANFFVNKRKNQNMCQMIRGNSNMWTLY